MKVALCGLVFPAFSLLAFVFTYLVLVYHAAVKFHFLSNWYAKVSLFFVKSGCGLEAVGELLLVFFCK